jgi:hypothetical protein
MPNVPDPDNDGVINLKPTGITYESPQFQHVMQACRSLIKIWRAGTGAGAYVYGGPAFVGG